MLSVLLAGQALSLNQSINIPSSGRILALPHAAAESQWRGVLVGSWTDMPYANWPLMASTLASYGVNFVDMGVISNYETSYQSVVVPWTAVSPAINFTQAINAFHAQGIQVYAHFATMIKAYNLDGIDRDCWYIPYNENISALQEFDPAPSENGGWLDIANPASVTLVHNLISELVSNYSIDGIVFDYTRWPDVLMPLGNYDFAQFQSDTGLGVGLTYQQWLSDVVPVAQAGTGIYYTQFLEWRTQLIDTFVKNITQWALAINPNLKFGTTCHTIFNRSPDYQNYNQGQDAAAWIKQGSIQFVMPMLYPNNYGIVTSSDISNFQSYMQAWQTYTLGGTHGIIPIVPCIEDGGAEFGYNLTVSNVTSVVSTLLASGADGWAINEYGGPGANPNSGNLDVRPYLNALNLPQTFALTNIATQALNSTSEQISWTTSSAANSTVEYNSSQLFVWSQLNATDQISTGFPYWQNTHTTGFIASNSVTVTNHAITLTGLTPGTTYYFRIQSGDPSGIATTPVMMFST
jgi:hypothetical protein